MQHIDRTKVQLARNSFFNPDTGSLLPTVDTMYANSTQSPMGSDNRNSFDFGQSAGLGNMTMTKDIITANELKGQCERLGSRPSQRQRIVITRSQDTRNRSF